MSNGHKVAALSFTVALALAGVVALLWLLDGPSVAHATPGTLYVAPDGNDASTCDSEANRCATIQRAVDVASPGDVIKVATGVYTDVHGRAAPGGYNGPGVIMQVVYISKTVTIQGGYTTTNWTTPYPITQPTTLDAQGQGRVIFVTGDISPTIEGLCITDGDAAGLGGDPGGDDAGGGVYVITARTAISSCVVHSNTAEYGGGMYLRSSDTTLSGNTVASNTVSSQGGGLFLDGGDAMLSDNIVASNTASGGGGGLYLEGSGATLSGNTVMSNTATGAGGGLYLFSSGATLSGNTVMSNTATSGGGLYLDYYCTATLSGNVVISNTADFGGGLYLDSSAATLSGNTVMSNTAWLRGGGLYLDNSKATLNGNTINSNIVYGTAPWGGGGGLLLINSTTTLSGNTVISNTAYYGGGINLYSSDATFSGDAFISNTAWRGGGLCLVYSDVTLNGNIVMFNTALGGGGGGLALVGGDATLTNTVVTDNQTVSVGSGLRIVDSSPRLLHTTIACNSGGDGSGVYITHTVSGPSVVALTNTILVSHSVGITVAAGSTATLESTLWHGNTTDWGGEGTIITGTHNYWGDPHFDADGYHLRLGSAAIDKGVDAGVTTDIDGDSRPLDFAPDLGADEVDVTTIYLPIILKNASP